MQTVLDIDLDFFVSPIQYYRNGNERVPEESAKVEDFESALKFIHQNCRLPADHETPGALFEHHDSVFDFFVKQIKKPVHLVHVDAHADIGGGFTSCWPYVLTEFLHLKKESRNNPKRGGKYLNPGNFIVFLAAYGCLDRITFVAPPDWGDDYNPLYMKNFDPCSEAIQLKRFPPEAVKQASLTTPLHKLAHETEDAIPFIRTSRSAYQALTAPDLLLVTRSPDYTPKSADALFEKLANLVDPL